MAGLVVAGLPAAAAVAGEAGAPPAYLGTLGGPGKAEVYPSGLETAPGGRLVVADTGLNRVRKLRADGSLVWSTGSYGARNGQFNNPRDTGIDSAGNVYVADTANTRIVKLSPSGAWVTSWKGAGAEKIGSPIGLSVRDDKVYVADGLAKKVRVYSTSGTQLGAFGSQGACTFSALRDVDADAAGNVYVANYTLHNVLKLSATGQCLTTWGSKGSADGQFAAPYGVSVRRDPVAGAERVYVADSNNNRIQVFSTSGAHVATMGRPGENDQPGTFTQLRRVAVAADGDVWGADLWGWRLVRFDRTASGYAPAQQIGTTEPGLTDTRTFGEPRGIAFANDGSLRIADTLHHRVVKMSPQGRVLGACGMRGSEPGELNWPRGVAVDPVTGDLWITDTKQYRLQVSKADCSASAFFGAKGTGAGQFDWPMAVTIRGSDRTAWVADTNNDRVVVWDVATRTQVAAFGSLGSGSGSFNQPRGIAVSPVDGHVFVADRSNNRVVELADTGKGAGIRVVRTMTGFNKPEGVSVGTDGRVWVADTLNDRLVVLSPDGAVLSTTSGPSGMSDPAAVAVGPDGRAYVSDTYGDRVLVFSAGTDGGGADTTPAESAITSPKNGAAATAPVTFAGTASDQSGVAAVDWLVQDVNTKKFWNAATGTWGARAWNPTTLEVTGETTVSWSASFAPALSSGSFLVRSRATDPPGNVETTLPTRRFTLVP